MGWVRTRQMLTGWLALFALALQLGLAFGHVHAGDFARPTLSQAGLPAPGPVDHPDTNHMDCAICAVVHLAGALLAPVPPALVTPTAFAPARHGVAIAHALPAIATASFHARAPPQA